MTNIIDRGIVINTNSGKNCKSLTISEMIRQNEYVSFASKKYSYKVYKTSTKIPNKRITNVMKNLQQDQFNGYKYVKREILSVKDPQDIFTNFVIFARHTINISLIKV